MQISREEFVEICADPGFCELLGELDIAKEDHPALFDTLDVDLGGTLDVNELIAGIGKLRGDARKSDIVSVMLSVRQLHRMLRNFRLETTDILDLHNENLCKFNVALETLAQNR